MLVVIAAFLLALHAPHVAAATTAVTTVSFLSYPAYLEQVECVKLCLWHVSAVDDLIVQIGCSSPWVNECFCKAELASSASSFLSGCVASRCTAPSTAPAVTSALSAYNEYCSTNGLPIPVVASIQSYPAYVSQSSCVQECVWSPSRSSFDDLMPGMGCGPPWDNACLCNADLASTAGAFLSTCVASKCSVGDDAPQVTAAIGLHGSYCSAAGLPIPLALATPQTTSTELSQSTGGPTTGPTSGHLPTETAAATEQSNASEHPPAETAPATEQSNASEHLPAKTAPATEQSNGLSAVAIAGIAVGAVAIIAVLVAFAVFVLYKRRRRPSETPPLPYAPEQPPQPPAQWAYEKATDSAAVEADWGTPVPRVEADHGAPRAFELPS